MVIALPASSNDLHTLLYCKGVNPYSNIGGIIFERMEDVAINSIARLFGG